MIGSSRRNHVSMAPLGGDLAARLARRPPSRLSDGLSALVASLSDLATTLKITPGELHQIIDYLTEVGHYADERRQEWVLLADALGLSATIASHHAQRPPGATPETGAGPFYRADAPDVENGANLSVDGIGTPLQVTGRVRALDGSGIPGALVEVWHANAEGRYENQEPDLQPEHNLRGRLRTDAAGRFHFRSIMPRGYALPSEGPVARLLTRLGLGMERPAHIHFRVTAEGYQRLTTQIFDRDDPAIEHDAIFGARPGLLAEFRRLPPTEAGLERAVEIDLVLAPAGPRQIS